MGELGKSENPTKRPTPIQDISHKIESELSILYENFVYHKQ